MYAETPELRAWTRVRYYVSIAIFVCVCWYMSVTSNWIFHYTGNMKFVLNTLDSLDFYLDHVFYFGTSKF